MQLPEQPPPPLAPLWDRVLRAQALPPDLDVQLLYIAIRDRLVHPEWEVRLHALRVLGDLLPLSGNALSFPFDQVVDNLGHSSPNVRKAALDALKVFCTHCEDPDCAARAILDKCSYHNIRPHSASIDTKVNVITGLILSIPSVMGILRRRNPNLDIFPVFEVLGDKLFDKIHRDVAQRSLLKLRRVCGARDYVTCLSKLDPKVQEKFRYLCETYDEDSMDVYYAPRKNYRESNQQLVHINHAFNSLASTPMKVSTDSSSSEESFVHIPYYNNHFGRVIIETEIKFDSETAITMTVLEEQDTESDKNSSSDCDSSDRNMLKYSDGDSEDTDVVVKKVRFGGESIKIRTPDSENQVTSEDDNNSSNKSADEEKEHIEEVSNQIFPVTAASANEIKQNVAERELKIKPKKSGIPLPVIQHKPVKQLESKQQPTVVATYTKVKLKSKSLSELYDYFKAKNEIQEGKLKEGTGFALTLTEVKSPEKVPSPVDPHREVEVLHNLQRSPVVSPKRKQTRLHLEHDGFVLNLLASSPGKEDELVSPRPPSPLRVHYAWEDVGIIPQHVADQLHNTENWIAAVKAADQLHSCLLAADAVKKVEPHAMSLVQHMWALSDSVSAARAPAEGTICALFRGLSNDGARNVLPALVARMGRDPIPAALPHALLQRLALHHLVDLVFDPTMIGVTGDMERLQDAQLRATLCLARAAGPAAVLSAVRRRLAGTTRADTFCAKLRERLSRPIEHIKPISLVRSSQLPVPVRRRARSTPPPAAPLPPRRLRPLPDSAPLPSITQSGRDYVLKRLSPIPLSDKDSSAFTSYEDEKKPLEDKKSLESVVFGETTEIITADEVDAAPPPPRSPSIRIEDYSDRSLHSQRSTEEQPQEKDHNTHHENDHNIHHENDHYIHQDQDHNKPQVQDHNKPQVNHHNQPSSELRSQIPVSSTPGSPRPKSRKSIKSPIPLKSSSSSPTKSSKSGNLSPEPVSELYESRLPCERDVRNALSECIIPAKHEDWEVIVNSMIESERLATDPTARAPAASWRAVVRSAAIHVRSLRSRVARSACCALGALFEHRGRALDTELEDAVTALLDRCADVNRFLRTDAASALVRIACGSNCARAAVALSRRGATHRAGPVRAAAAQALARLVQHNGPSRTLDMSPEPRTIFLRAAGELLGDASPEARVHARHLCMTLAEDPRFHPMLKEAMLPSRYRAIEKFVDKLRCR